MTPQELAIMGEILGAVGVIGFLFFVGWQIKASARAGHRATLAVFCALLCRYDMLSIMIIQPDLTSRPLKLSVERAMSASPNDLFAAWTTQLDRWFAAPGTLTMAAEVGAAFFFETHFDGQRHPHYGRYLRLVPDQLIELTWVTGEPGTRGAETIVTIELAPTKSGTQLKLAHAGFADEQSMNGHEQAWPGALAHLDKSIAEQEFRHHVREEGS
jgi:uncharacterized protein YndB with AHSA1/START domain